MTLHILNLKLRSGISLARWTSIFTGNVQDYNKFAERYFSVHRRRYNVSVQGALSYIPRDNLRVRGNVIVSGLPCDFYNNYFYIIDKEIEDPYQLVWNSQFYTDPVNDVQSTIETILTLSSMNGADRDIWLDTIVSL